jgi:hypothetical protein
MTARALVRLAATIGLLVLLGAPLAQQSKPITKGEKRPPPPPSAMGGLPAGADAGTPGTSNSEELGLKTAPMNDADRAGVKQESAAARAAARQRRAPAPVAPFASGAAPANGAASGAVNTSAAKATNGKSGKAPPKTGTWTP